MHGVALTRTRAREETGAGCVVSLHEMALPLMVTALSIGMAAATPVASSAGTGNYTADWASIDSRPLPSWYDDAKIGLFIHCESSADRRS